MKRIIIVLTLILCSSLVATANNNHNNTTILCQCQDNKMIEVLVEANAAVDDLCEYFNGSWADTGLKIYCMFNKASVVCTAYKIVKVTCAVNGAVRLMIEGDWNNAIKQSLVSSAEIYTLTKLSRDSFQLSPSRNSSPVNW